MGLFRIYQKRRQLTFLMCLTREEEPDHPAQSAASGVAEIPSRPCRSLTGLSQRVSLREWFGLASLSEGVCAPLLFTRCSIVVAVHLYPWAVGEEVLGFSAGAHL